jgi:2-polyprenyl-6-methoxyphenol hydroxylase-like FAD-dependent oxidoreductase
VNVLISGAGIAGPTLAFWLQRYGVTPTLVEEAPALRTGGYIIDFWGAGFEIADRMGLLPDIRAAGYKVREVRVVGSNGRRVAGFPVDVFARATNGRYISLRRGDLADVLFSRLGEIETVFGDSIANIEQDHHQAMVTFESGVIRPFDLVVGADGLHSRVRELTLGAENQFEHYLGLKVAAFEVSGYRPRDELVYVMYTEVGRQVARFAMRDDRTMFLLIFADTTAGIPADLEEQKTVLRERFAGSGWECPRVMDALERVSTLYFDRVSQIDIPQESSWAKDRVVLVGDAASCISLLGGQGSALAMTAAYLLAGEIHRAGCDYRTAFARYEDRFRPFVAAKQRMAVRFADSFAPKSKFSMFVRNRMMNLLTIPWVAHLVMGGSFVDALKLPDY